MAVIDLSDPSIRRKLAIAIGFLVLAIGIGAYSLSNSGPRVISAADAMAFYTVDGGATTFADKASLAPPFDHGGKPAVQALVFSSDGGKTKTVGYLQRYNAESKKTLATSPKTLVTPNGIEVSKPGPTQAWSPANSQAGMAILHNAATNGPNVEQLLP